MTTSTTIRPAASGDSAAVARLASELGVPTDAAEAATRLAGIRGDGAQVALVAEVDGEVVGWVHVVESTSLQSGTLVEIRGLVVAASARRTGVGRALVAAAEAWAAARWHELIRVRTDVRRDEARAFYLGIGYEERKRQVLLTRRLTSRVIRTSAVALGALGLAAMLACGRSPEAAGRTVPRETRSPVSDWFVIDPAENSAIAGDCIHGIGFDGLPPQPIERRPLELPAGANPERRPVIVETVIGPSGRIARARIVKGPTGPEIEQAVVRALEEWWFEPARDRDSGEAVTVRFVVTPALAASAP